jgi:tRNA(fMet)-specific endonuclease VapC
MTVITLGLLRSGAEKSQARERAMATIQQLEGLIHPRRCPKPPVSTTPNSGRGAKGRRPHAHGWILVSSNTREFARVPGLQLENWSEEASAG